MNKLCKTMSTPVNVNLDQPQLQDSVPSVPIPTGHRYNLRKRKARDAEAHTDFERPAKVSKSRKRKRSAKKDRGDGTERSRKLTEGGSSPTVSEGSRKTTSEKSRKRKVSEADVETGFIKPDTIVRPRSRPIESPAKRPTCESPLGAEKAEQEEQTVDRDNGEQLPTLLEEGAPAEFDTKYEQKELLGEGAFGCVYAGVRRPDMLPVAIKRIPKHGLTFNCWTIKGEEREVPAEVMFMCQAGCASGSCGPFVCLFDWYRTGEEVVLVMERPTDSQDLFEYCQENGPLSENLARDLTRQLVSGVAELHNKNIFHRDIKTDNLLIQNTHSGPRLRIIDFGIAKRVQSIHDECYSMVQIGITLDDMTEDFNTDVDNRQHYLSNDYHDFVNTCLTATPETTPGWDRLVRHAWFMD